jgi:hypothetical protein
VSADRRDKKNRTESSRGGDEVGGDVLLRPGPHAFATGGGRTLGWSRVIAKHHHGGLPRRQ